MNSSKAFEVRAVRGLALAMTCAAGAVLTGCDDDDDGGGITTPSVGVSEVRVVHASPDAPPVDVYVAGSSSPIVEDLAYGDASDYLPVDEGTYQFQIRAADASATSPPAFQTGDVVVPADARITAVAAGLLAELRSVDAIARGDDDQFRVLVLAEAFDAPGAGNAAVRILHASPDAPAVAIDVGNDGSSEIASLARFADTGAAGVALPAGTMLDVGVRTTDTGALVTSFTTPPLGAEVEYFLIATGLLSAEASAVDGFSLLAVSPSGEIGFIPQNGDERGMAQLRVVHASANAPDVDVYVAGSTTPLFAGAGYGATTDYMSVEEGTYTIELRGAGADPTSTPAYELADVVVPADAVITAIAFGDFESTDMADRFRVMPYVEAFAMPAMGEVAVRIVHGSPDAPAVALDVNADGTAEISSAAADSFKLLAVGPEGSVGFVDQNPPPARLPRGTNGD